jgi:hypothetical protein
LVSKTELEDLLTLQSELKELISTYDNLETLIYADFIKALRTISQKSRKDTKLRRLGYWNNMMGAGINWYIMNLGFGIKGGFLVSVLYKRRAQGLFKVIISTCALYLNNQMSPENLKIAEQIIQEIRDKQNSMSKLKDESVERFSSILKQLSIILGIPVIATVLWERIVPTLDPLFPNIPQVILFLPSMIILVLEIVMFYILPKIRWYRILLKIYEIKDKKSNVYDSLLPIERIVLSRHFPKIKEVLDEP